MYGTSTISALFQKEFLDSKSLQNRIVNQIGNSKLKTENRKENKTEKIEEGSLPGRSPVALSTTSAHWSLAQDTCSVSDCQAGPTEEKNIFFFLSPMGSTRRR
jgi:hypothetical protein